MDTNPYKTPRSPLEPQTPLNTIWWRLYFWLTAALTVLGAWSLPLIKGLTVFDAFDFVLSTVGVAGVYGFAFYKPIGLVVFWRYYFYVALIESVFFLALLPAFGVKLYGEALSINAYLPFQVAYGVLFLIAIHQYAYRRPFIWRPS